MARGKTVNMHLDKSESGAFGICLFRGKRAIEAGLRLAGYDEPDLVRFDAAQAKLDAGDPLSTPELLQLEIVGDTGLQVVTSQDLVANTGPMERALKALKAAIR